MVLMLMSMASFAQKQDTIIINGTKFLFIKTHEKNIDFSSYPHDTLVNVYRIENGNRHYLLQHRLYNKASDCNNTFIEKGSYKIEGDSMIFITDFLQERNDPIIQKSTQVYRVNATGQMILISDKGIDHDGRVIDNMK